MSSAVTRRIETEFLIGHDAGGQVNFNFRLKFLVSEAIGAALL